MSGGTGWVFIERWRQDWGREGEGQVEETQSKKRRTQNEECRPVETLVIVGCPCATASSRRQTVEIETVPLALRPFCTGLKAAVLMRGSEGVEGRQNEERGETTSVAIRFSSVRW